MPKVSEEHKERRREQILDGARRCFAQHGYEGATVARLEQEIGLSRGAIFNYFPNKDALFVELAIEMSRRYTDIWLNEGFRAVLGAIVEADADWLSVQFEVDAAQCARTPSSGGSSRSASRSSRRHAASGSTGFARRCGTTCRWT